jgi:glycosyltransferase involved in cell wall biosynthesis
MKSTITLTMIVRNEAANIENCLNSVYKQVDEIVIVDTGSTDNTVEIARSFTDKIYFYPWQGDFSAARNFALDKAKGEWIIYLDADEELLCASDELKSLVSRDQETEAYLLPINNPTTDFTGVYNRYFVLRLFKNNGSYRFGGKIHEQVIVPQKSVVGIAESPVINHKLLPAKERNRKRGRNLALLKQALAEDPHNNFLQYYLGVEWLTLGKPAQALPYLKSAYHNLTDEYLLFRGPALRYLLVCLQSLGRLDEAICLCLEADLKYPEYTDIYYLAGHLFEEKEEYSLAIKWFTQAVKCGTPPPLYSHLAGTESFLAYYHLGFCLERLGETEKAMDYYVMALEANRKYIYPIYNLFVLLLNKYGAHRTLAYFQEQKYLNNVELALAVAHLFFQAGYGDLARECLESCNIRGNKDEEVKFHLGKYSISSGRLLSGLQNLSEISTTSTFYTQAQLQRTIAFLLEGSFPEARILALELWKNHQTRCHGYVLLNLIRFLERDEMITPPQKIRGMDVLKPVLELLSESDCCLPDPRLRQCLHYWKLRQGLETFLKNISPEGYLHLVEHYQEKSSDLRTLIEYKFGCGGTKI